MFRVHKRGVWVRRFALRPTIVGMNEEGRFVERRWCWYEERIPDPSIGAAAGTYDRRLPKMPENIRPVRVRPLPSTPGGTGPRFACDIIAH